MKETVIAVIVSLAFLALVAVIQGEDFFLYRFFAPKYEQVRRQTFEQSKAYNQGMIQELQNMQFQYEQASPEHKTALASIILHRAADYPSDAMPQDLSRFVQSLKNQPEKY